MFGIFDYPKHRSHTRISLAYPLVSLASQFTSADIPVKYFGVVLTTFEVDITILHHSADLKHKIHSYLSNRPGKGVAVPLEAILLFYDMYDDVNGVTLMISDPVHPCVFVRTHKHGVIAVDVTWRPAPWAMLNAQSAVELGVKRAIKY